MVLFFALLLASALISGSLLLIRRWFGERLKEQEYIHSSIFGFFTTLYAFFIGFAIVTLWSAFLTAKATVSREAEAIVVAYRTAQGLPHSEPLRAALKNYVKAVIEAEWPQMEIGSMSEAASQKFDVVLNNLCDLGGDSNRVSEIYANLGEAGKQRLSRATTMQGNLYPPVWMILILGFVAVIFGFYLINREHIPGSFTFEFMVIFMVLSCLYFIYDIDTPFSGVINVPPDAFKVAYQRLLAWP
jgi:hypothetical protein